jgi:quinol monooxygenase YgiN
MYGTVARFRVKKGALEGLRQLVEDFTRTGMPGYCGQFVYQMESDPNELYVAVVFENRQVYFANAESPEQHERYLEMLKYLEGEPEWHDGELLLADYK